MPTTERTRTKRLRVAVIAAGALICVAAAVVIYKWSTAGDEQLLKVSSSEWPSVYSIDKGEESRYEDFHGIMVGVSTVVPPTAEEDHCLIVVANGSVRGSCAPKDQEALVEMVVGEGSPVELKDSFPLGTKVRFTYDGQDVTVLSQ